MRQAFAFVLLLPFIVLSLAQLLLGEEPAPKATSAATAVAEAWVQAVQANDVLAVKKLFADVVKDAPEYTGGEEALRFWQKQLRSLEKKEFEGKWKARVDTLEDGTKVVFVFPLLKDKPAREAIWVIQSGGTWKIRTLFNSPPDSRKQESE
jgi:hypothetical protein